MLRKIMARIEMNKETWVEIKQGLQGFFTFIKWMVIVAVVTLLLAYHYGYIELPPGY